MNFRRPKAGHHEDHHTTSGTLLAKLRSLPVEQIVDGGQETAGPGGPATYSGPILDGKLVERSAQSAYEAGRIPKIALMIRNNSAEVPAGFVNARSKDDLLALFGPSKDEVKAAYDPKTGSHS